MSIDKQHPDYLYLRTNLRENPKDFVAIVGSGLSRPCGLPSWSELRDHLVNHARARKSERPEDERGGVEAALSRIEKETDLWNAFSELEKIIPKPAYEQAICDQLTLKDGVKVPQAYDLLWRLGIKGIITFNLDCCACDSFANVNSRSVDCATAKDTARFPQFVSSGRPFVFQPHGIIQDRSTWVFTLAERSNLLHTTTYLDFMKNIYQSKHLLIVGFNPQDFAFTYLMETVLAQWVLTGTKHYMFIPNPSTSLLTTYSEKGFAVIPYSPSDTKLHLEIADSLKDFLNFLPQDGIAASVYIGPQQDPFALPTDEELIQRPINEVREILNGAIAGIIPPESSPNEEDIEKLDAFYVKHLRAIHLAWLIQPASEYDNVHDYKVTAPKGRGAFGQVYEAENVVTKEKVAIKVLLPEARQNRDYLNSFRRGVRSMRILTDSHVKRMVHLINAFEVPACIVMDFIEGPTLTEAVSWNFFDQIGRCLDCLIQIGEVVHEAHNLKERVLHRDLKPDNIILRDGYNKGELLDVVVVDFDLSWHEGTSDLSVVHGARAQGYAAPEQTATGKLSGISTRHTAVDTFGYGMLAYFLFTGVNPRPNEQNFDGFEKKIMDAINKRFLCHWHSLPSYLANIIIQCTQDDQRKRIPFSDALSAFRNAREIVCADRVVATDPILLEELAAILSPDKTPTRNDFGRHLILKGIDPSKETELMLVGNGDEISVDVKISKVRSHGDNRNVVKYLDKAKDKATSRLQKQPMKNVAGLIGQSRLTISATWPLTKTVSRKDIENVAQLIQDARTDMELN